MSLEASTAKEIRSSFRRQLHKQCARYLIIVVVFCFCYSIFKLAIFSTTVLYLLFGICGYLVRKCQLHTSLPQPLPQLPQSYTAQCWYHGYGAGTMATVLVPQLQCWYRIVACRPRSQAPFYYFVGDNDSRARMRAVCACAKNICTSVLIQHL